MHTITHRTHVSFVGVQVHASNNHGIIRTPDLHALGFTDPMISRRVRLGELVRLYRGVYAVGHTALTQLGRWHAAVCAGGDGAALCGVSAAQFWKIDRSRSARIHVAVPKRRRRRRGFTSHVCAELADDVVVSAGVRVTSVVRTILDLRHVYGAQRLARVIKEAEYLQLVTLAELAEACRAARGNPRVEVLEAALRLRHAGSSGPDSRFEEDVLAYLATLPIDQPMSNVEVVVRHGRPLRVDLVWSELGIGAEVNGTVVHARPAERHEDVRRRGKLEAVDLKMFVIDEEPFRRDPEAATAPVVHAVMAAMLRRLQSS